MNRRFLALGAFLAAISAVAFAGGPAFVAGAGFDPPVKGRPITWANGTVQYYTDQGDLSPVLSGGQADLFVADVVTRWSSIPGAAITVTQTGHLAEDVNGTNTTGNPDGTYSIPADIQPGAVSTPVGIVYDYDGQVTDALLGEGAGSASLCFFNTVFGGPDAFSFDAHIVHALIVINGVCATDPSRFPDLRYRLARTLGRVFGLGWSQANPNVITRNPVPVSDDLEGFPLMHFLDPDGCVPISACYPDADIPKMDDRASLSRLYPAAPTAARIHGSVYFADASGNPTQPMQGVNVVARRIESGQPSRKSAVTSVSGFAFRGDAGNPVNGYVDIKGQPCDFFGSNDPVLEGAFDLAGLEIPDGSSSANYQLSVEGLDANWAMGAGPYAPYQVAPSGSFTPMIVTVQRVTDVMQDIFMQQSAVAGTHPGNGATYTNPARLPEGGAWGAWISGYGDADWFQFSAKANRTASVSATALDEAGKPAQSKLMPVIGIWQLSDRSGNPAPAATPIAFNTVSPGMTRLDAQFTADDIYRVGIADLRGDGRPDYFYTATLLYSDTVTPSRVGLSGGPVILHGLGFNPALQLTTGVASGAVLETGANDLTAVLPHASQDGPASLVVSDPATGGFSQMTDALTYGAAASDKLLALQNTEPSTPIGAEAPNAIRVRAVAADGITPVAGATIAWSTTNGATLSACGGAATCSVLTDESGIASTGVTPMATGTNTITAALAPASYNPPQAKQATVTGTKSALDIGAIAPTKWVAQGATVDIPLTVRVLSQGTPQIGATVNFRVSKGAATLSSATSTTDNSGYASTSAHVSNHSADAQITACVAPNNSPCQTFTLFATPASKWALNLVSGSSQVVPVGQPFQPLLLRATDGSAASDPVIGMPFVFDVTLMRLPKGDGGGGGGDDGHGGGNGTPVILGTYQVQSVSDTNGLAGIVPTLGSVNGYCDVMIAVAAGPATMQFHLQALTPMPGSAPAHDREPPFLFRPPHPLQYRMVEQ